MRIVDAAAVLAGCASWADALAVVTPAPAVPTDIRRLLEGRATSDEHPSICGFEGGDPSKPWVANKGFNCRSNTDFGVFGFCPTTLTEITDCSLGVYCVDSGRCRSGCGRSSLLEQPGARLVTW